MSRRQSRTDYQQKYPYPRHRGRRTFLRGGIHFLAWLLLDYKVYGRENIPEKGPLIVVGNHFHFLDTVAPIHITPYLLEFINDAIMPMAPSQVKFLPRLWKTLRIEQGTANLEALRAADAVLCQDGVLGIMPEGHVHKPPLSSPLPGAAYLALVSGAPILPIGTYSEDNWDIFGTPRRERRKARVVSRVGKVFGPLGEPNPEKRPGRAEVAAAGQKIMTRLAELLPAHARGVYADQLDIEPQALL